MIEWEQKTVQKVALYAGRGWKEITRKEWENMKNTLNVKMLYQFYHHAVKAELKQNGFSADIAKKINAEHRKIIERAKEIGKSRLLRSYIMTSYFIAMVCRQPQAEIWKRLGGWYSARDGNIRPRVWLSCMRCLQAVSGWGMPGTGCLHLPDGLCPCRDYAYEISENRNHRRGCTVLRFSI